MKKGRRMMQRLLTTLLCLALCTADIIPTGMTVLAQEQEAQPGREETDTAGKKDQMSEEEMEAEESAENESSVKESDEEAALPVEEAQESVSENAMEEEEKSALENAVEEEQDSVSDNTTEEEANAISVMEASEEIIASGTSNDISWVIDADGKLTVSGTGDFEREDGKPYDAPWYVLRESIKTAEINVTGMTDASYMFYDCQNLTDIDLTNFNTSSVTDMSFMFDECSHLTMLDVSHFDTSNVTDMSFMFYFCSNLTTLDVSHFDTGNVTNMDFMFSYCSNLTTLDVSRFNTSSVTDMSNMFYSCSNLITIYTPRNVKQNVKLPSESGYNWQLPDGTAVTELPKNLADSIVLKKTEVPSIASGTSNDISWVIYADGTLKVSGTGDFERIDGKYAPWYNHRNSIKAADINVTGMTNASYMFADCINLSELNLRGFYTSAVKDMSNMFSSCTSLTELDLGSFYTSAVTDMSSMFSGCTSLTTLILKDFDYGGEVHFYTDNVTDMSSMFSGCTSLTTLDLSDFNTGSVTNMSGMFSGCTNLTGLDLSNFDTGSVTAMSGMFDGCEKLTTIYTPCNVKQNVGLPSKTGDKWYRSDGSVVTELPKELDYSIALKKNGTPTNIASGTSGNVSWVIDANRKLTVSGSGDFEWDWNAPWYDNIDSIRTAEITVTDMTDASNMFAGCSNLISINLKNFDTSKVTDMSGMFGSCSKLATLDLSNFNTENVTDMSNMFGSCRKLVALDLSNFNTENVTDMSNMFYYCTELTTVNVSSFDTGKVTDMHGMFDHCLSLKMLDVRSFNTENVTDMERMFHACASVFLTTLNLSSFDVGNVTNMTNMLTSCPFLTEIHTPRNVKQIAVLPTNSHGIKWYLPDGTVVTSLPQNLDYSVVLSITKPNDDPKDDDGVDDRDIPEDGVIPKGLWISNIAAQTYTGSAIKPEVRVYDGEKRLKQGTDYTLSYQNNTKAAQAGDAKPPTVVVKSKGNYSGTETKTFTITKQDISDVRVTKSFTDAYAPSANGKNPTLVFSAKFNNKALKKNTDYTLTVKNSAGNEVTSYGAVGTYTAVVKGAGNYTGEYSFSFEVLNKIPVSKLKISKIPAVNYDGTSKSPEPVIKYGKVTLNKGTDYTLSYLNNTAIGTATIVITGMGDYFGTRNITFSIAGLPIKQAKFTGFIKSFPYTGNKLYQSEAVLTYGGEKLVQGTDYTVSYSNCLNKGKAAVTYTGIGKYTGTIKKTYSITSYNIATDAQKRINLSTDTISAAYAKGGARPSLKVYDGTRILTEGKDYTLSYQNNAAVTTSATKNQPTITVKGKGNYAGTFSEKKTFTITTKEIAEVTVTAPDVAASSKIGKYKSTPVLTDITGKKLKAGTDYEKTYTYTYKETTEKVLNNGTEVTRNAGDPVEENDIVPANTVLCVRIKAKEGGNYTGEKTAEYRIVTSLINKAKITVLNPAQDNKNLFPYTGQEIRLDKSNLTVKIGKDVLSDDQYEILEDTYKNNIGKGTASVQIRGTGNYGGTATVKFKIGTKGFQWVQQLFG